MKLDQWLQTFEITMLILTWFFFKREHWFIICFPTTQGSCPSSVGQDSPHDLLEHWILYQLDDLFPFQYEMVLWLSEILRGHKDPNLLQRLPNIRLRITNGWCIGLNNAIRALVSDLRWETIELGRIPWDTVWRIHCKRSRTGAWRPGQMLSRQSRWGMVVLS